MENKQTVPQYPQVISQDFVCGTNVKIAPDARITAETVVLEDEAEIHEGVEITGKRVRIGKKSIIQQHTRIIADALEIGYKSVIEKDCSFRAINGASRMIRIGDYALIGYGQNILTPEFSVGDYTTLHHSLLISGYKPFAIGHNCWVGQDSILNCTETLNIGNNVGIGTGSQVWTHIAYGELLEGSMLFGEYPVTIEDNVWIVGGAVISPNLTLGNSSVIMTGAVVTKDTEPRHTYAGVPARDVTDRIPAYQDINPDEKYRMMSDFVSEFHAATDNRYAKRIILADSLETLPSIDDSLETIVIIKSGEAADTGTNISVFSLETKNYTKKRTGLEESFIRFTVRYRARFLPV